jgi:hypothetical protein
MNTITAAKAALCWRCTHYFVTYDARFPHGCRAMGFKSARLPHTEVAAATGTTCVTFAAKPSAPRRKT